MALSMDFVKGVYESPFLNVILHPFKELFIDLKSIFIERHNTVRSIIRACILFPAIIVGALLPLVLWPDLHGKFTSFGSGLGVPNELLNTFSIYAGAWVLGYPVAWLSKQVIRAVCLCIYGDADWILNNRRMNILEAHTAGLSQEYREAFEYVLYQYHRMGSEKSFRDEDCIEYLRALVYHDPENAYKVMREVLEFKKHRAWKDGHVEDLLQDQIIGPAADYYQIDPALVKQVLQRLCEKLQNNEQTQSGVRDSAIIDNIHHVIKGSLEGFKIIIPEISSVFHEREVLEHERLLVHQQLERLVAHQNSVQQSIDLSHTQTTVRLPRFQDSGAGIFPDSESNVSTSPRSMVEEEAKRVVRIHGAEGYQLRGSSRPRSLLSQYQASLADRPRNPVGMLSSYDDGEAYDLEVGRSTNITTSADSTQVVPPDSPQLSPMLEN